MCAVDGRRRLRGMETMGSDGAGEMQGRLAGGSVVLIGAGGGVGWVGETLGAGDVSSTAVKGTPFLVWRWIRGDP